MLHVKVEAYRDEDMWCARGVKEDIFTQASTYDELIENVKSAVHLHYEDELKGGEKIDLLLMVELEIIDVA
jgi:predicted RNase H-like HicB family nuclease